MNKSFKYCLILILLLMSNGLFGQDTIKANPGEVIIHGARHIIEDGDTIRISVLREFKHKDPNFEREYNRTVFFARRMYTYTEIIDSIVKAHDSKLDSISKLSKKKRKKARKTNRKLKKSLKSEFSYEIKNLTNIRGDYLTKMVHKKIGLSSYELIKKYKNGRIAFFWNSILWSFGSTNLKNKYDPKKDWMLKLVIDDIEAGKIKTLSRAQLIQEMKNREERDKNRKKKKKK